MASEIPGTGGPAGGLPIPPTASVRPAVPSRALVPVDRTTLRPSATDTPLGRSGVALEDLLFAPDVLETRDAVAPVALEVGLESARGHLLQRRPMEALTTLDAVWAGAEGSEEGWYLRSGALTVAGHPAEGDRVAGEALESRPHSLALRLVQSVARAIVGDLSGARAALLPALEHAPDEPVLLAQQAVVLARQGHGDDASDLLARLAARSPDHPALVWARAAVRMAATDRARSAALPALELPDADRPGPQHRAPTQELPTRGVEVHGMDGGGMPVEPQGEGDMVVGAFRTLGAQLREADPETVQRLARTLLRACSAGGTLEGACTPQEGHAARQLLSALLVVVRGHAPAALANSPLQQVMAQLAPLLREAPSVVSGRGAAGVADAERLLRRQGGKLPPPVRTLLQALVQGATDTRPGDTRVETGRPEVLGRLFDEPEQGPLVPVRLGLTLLTDTPATRALERLVEPLDGARTASPPPGPDAVVLSMGTPVGATPGVFTRSGEWITVGTGETTGSGWGGASAVHDARGGSHEADRPLAAALPAIVLVAAALGAAVSGAGRVAAVLAGAALWMALRRPAA